jgi:hypothetical protein
VEESLTESMHNPEDSLPIASGRAPEEAPAGGILFGGLVTDKAMSARPMRRRIIFVGAILLLLPLGWGLVRYAGLDAGGPRETARAALESLGRGEWRTAYDLFSIRYRLEVPFEVWRSAHMAHRRMFRARTMRIDGDAQSDSRAVLEAHVVAESGERYLARFALIRIEGRWWVDELRWSRERRDRALSNI